MTRFPLCLLAFAGCAIADASPATLPPDDAPPSRPAGTTRLRMRDHFDGLREIERSLVRGDLDHARERATRIAFDRADRELPSWAPYIARMQAAASTLSQAMTVGDGCRAAAQLAAECAACHAASGAMPEPTLAPLPRDGATLAERMARHQWAVDRLWEGVIGASDTAWRQGLAVLAASPLPAATISTDPERQGAIKKNARSLQRQARYAQTVTAPAARARVYAQLLMTCSGCHGGDADDELER